ncbi:MAG TPA: hypothetical protein VGM81_07005 [Burkholderiaceae bacterium]|jgi:hypothetical protein
MSVPIRDTAQVRLDNALRLFDEFVAAAVKHPDAATLRGLERRFAERLQIQPSYWSQIKSRSRQIGERLARQFEQLFHKPQGWMDHEHGVDAPMPAPAAASTPALPQDDDERFIMGLVLTFYRRHPQRARARLLDILGEVLTPEPAAPAAAAGKTAAARTTPPVKAAPSPVASELDDWHKLQQGVAPLKPKKR